MRFSRHFKYGLLSLLLGTSISCTNSSSLTMIISNIPENSAEIKISATIDNKSYSIDPISQEQKESNALIVKVNIPFDTRGLPLRLSVVSKDSKCELAGWSGVFGSVENGDYTINTPLEKRTDDPIAQDLFSVQALSENDVWAAGTTLVHWDGCYWKQKIFEGTNPSDSTDKISTFTSITKLYKASDNTLFAIGNNSSIYYYSNNAWEKIDIGNPWSLTADLSKNIIWTDITSLANTQDQLLVIGIVPGLVRKAIKLIKSNGKYVPHEATAKQLGDLETAIFSQPIQLSDCIHRFKCSAGSTCTYKIDSASYLPTRIYSLPNNFYTSGSVSIERTKTTGTQITTEKFKYSTYSIFKQNNISLTPRPDIRIFNSLAEDGKPTGDDFAIFGLSDNDLWLGSDRLFHITSTPPLDSTTEFLPTGINNRDSSGYKFGVIWGASQTDIWTIAFGVRISQTLHLITKTATPWNDLGIDSFYRVPLDNFVTTAVHGVSTSDVWIVGYNGYRIHYKDGKFSLNR